MLSREDHWYLEFGLRSKSSPCCKSRNTQPPWWRQSRGEIAGKFTQDLCQESDNKTKEPTPKNRKPTQATGTLSFHIEEQQYNTLLGVNWQQTNPNQTHRRAYLLLFMSRKRKIILDPQVLGSDSKSAREGQGESSSSLVNRWTGKPFSDRYFSILEARKKLPVYLFKEKLVESVKNNQIVICEGETGSGKTTQVLLLFFFLFDKMEGFCS